MKIKSIFLSIVLVTLVSYDCSKSGGGFSPRCPAIAKEADRIILHTEQGSDGRFWIMDDMGRTVILKGVALGNSSKVPPHIPIWLRDKDPGNSAFSQLHDWGVNSVRMLILWEGLEPTRGTTDCEYLDLIEEMVDMAKEKGIVVILDMHQDLFSRFLCGDGAPRWAVKEKYIEEIDCSAQWQYLSLHWSTRSAWTDFWTDKSMQENFIRTWQEVVYRFRNKANIVGYDLLNEPMPGSFYLEEVETKYMRELYERLIAGIRELDKDCLIIIEPSIEGNFGVKTKLTSFDVPNIVFSPHYYNVSLLNGPGAIYDRTKDITSKYLSDFERISKENILAPFVIGEYGMRTDRNGYDNYVAHQMIEMENATVGSMYWTYFWTGRDWQDEDMSLVNHDGKNPLIDERPADTTTSGQQRCHVEYFVRPYPMKTAGELIKYKFEFSFSTTTFFDYLGDTSAELFKNTKIFTLSFKETGVQGDTEIFVPRDFHYGGDAMTITTSAGTWTWSTDDTNILLWTTDHSETGVVREMSIYPNPSCPEYGCLTKVLHPGCEQYTEVKQGD